MNTKVFPAIAAAFAALLSVASCGFFGDGKNNDGTLCFRKVSEQQTFVLKGSAADYGTDDDILYCCRADIMMPEFHGDTEGIADSIRSVIVAKTFSDSAHQTNTVEEAFHSLAAQFGYTPADTIVPDNTYDGYTIIEGDVATLTPTILSYAVTVSTYDPMETHGMYGTSYVNCYFGENGTSIISLSDIVTEEGRKALPAILRGIASTMRRFIGWSDLKALPADDNFYIDLRNNIIFVYQPCEIASYSQGIIEIPVPAYQISDYLTDTGKQIFNL